MSTTLADIYTPPRIEDIDSALDRFNDAMAPLHHTASYLSLRWGEGLILVESEEGDRLAEFYSGTPGFLDDFNRFTDQTIDATSVPRNEILEATTA